MIGHRILNSSPMLWGEKYWRSQ